MGGAGGLEEKTNLVDKFGEPCNKKKDRYSRSFVFVDTVLCCTHVISTKGYVAVCVICMNGGVVMGGRWGMGVGDGYDGGVQRAREVGGWCMWWEREVVMSGRCDVR